MMSISSIKSRFTKERKKSPRFAQKKQQREKPNNKKLSPLFKQKKVVWANADLQKSETEVAVPF